MDRPEEKRMNKRIFLSVVLFALLLSACSPASSAAQESATQSMDRASASDGYAAPAPAAGAPAFSNSASEEYDYEIPAAVERVVIKNASLEIVVQDPITSVDAITRMAEEMGGFVVNSNTYRIRTQRGNEVPEANITVRVPATRLNEAMERIKALVGNPGEDVINENISGQDVTQEYTDLQSRLKNQEDAAAVLRTIMDEAKRTEDVLRVYQELNRVTEQIEVLKGQIKYYEESARLSAISVRIQSKEAVTPITVAGWTPVGDARDALQALVDTLQYLAKASIWIVVFCLPLGLLLLVPLYFIHKGFRRYQARRQPLPAAE
jgi:peptidoglycan hydrolase CwlO-like protein